MRHLRDSDYRRMAWKNGKGTTTEIAVHPPHAGLAGVPFEWRVSIADVAESGPFSRFPGYDRTIMVIEGDQGMWLDGAPGGPIDLTRAFEPQRFSGDREITGRLIGSPLRDFNLMVARGWGKGNVAVQRQPGPFRLAAPAKGHALLTVFAGTAVSRQGDIFAPGETLLLDSREIVEGLARSQQSGDVALAMIVMSPA